MKPERNRPGYSGVGLLVIHRQNPVLGKDVRLGQVVQVGPDIDRQGALSEDVDPVVLQLEDGRVDGILDLSQGEAGVLDQEVIHRQGFGGSVVIAPKNCQVVGRDRDYIDLLTSWGLQDVSPNEPLTITSSDTDGITCTSSIGNSGNEFVSDSLP